MTPSLFDLVDRHTGRPVRANTAAVQRLIGIMDLTPAIPADGIRRAIADELDDQRRRGFEALAEWTGERGAGRARELLEAQSDFPRAALLDLDAAEPVRVAVDEIVQRYDRFTHRLRWLLEPTTFDEVQTLDPIRDANQIYHFVSWDFRVEQKAFAVLFETRPVMLPMAALFFHSTGEFMVRAFQRINDTVMFFANMIEWGLDSKRGRAAIARVNRIHGRYSIPTEAFRFILGGLMFVPDIWNEKLGWRRWTEVERIGWFNNFREMGHAMNILDIEANYDAERAWWWDTSTRICAPTAAGKNVFVEIALQVLATYPPDLRKPIVAALLAGMDDAYRDNLGFPPPPADVVEELRHAFRLVGGTMRSLPRVPWMRSLQLYPAYYDVDVAGIPERSKFMPKPSMDGPNHGYPEHLEPARAPNAAPEPELPVVTAQEVSRHDTPDDPWLIIDGYVYDLKRFFYEHPGGHGMLEPWLGKDATAAFHRIAHSNAALVILANFRVAKLATAPAVVPVPRVRDESKVKPRTPKRTYTREDWDQTLDLVATLTAKYEKAKAAGERDPKAFPIELPTSPRVAATKEPA